MIRFTELPFRIWNGGFLALQNECQHIAKSRLAGINFNGQKRQLIVGFLFVLPKLKNCQKILEFQLHGNGVMYWEGYLDVPYTN